MSHLASRRLRAPQGDGAALIDPPLEQIPALVDRNRSLAGQFSAASGFRSELRDQARAWLLDPPRICVASAVKPDPNRTIIATGHQPELFHPGVWFKNFLADAIARKVNAVAANVVVDNDLARSSSIRVPTKCDGTAQIGQAFYDVPAVETTWENRHVNDAATFRKFAADARKLFRPMMQGASYEEGILLDRLWPHAVNSFDRQNGQFSEFSTVLSRVVGEAPPAAVPPFGVLATCLTEARSRVEKDFGLNVSDCPLSELAEHRPFLEFTRLLLSRYQELHSTHNGALAEYRAANHIRSRTHPVPELSAEGEWREVPFWISTFENPVLPRLCAVY